MNIKSLADLRKEFSTDFKCRTYLKKMRWVNGVTCPHCGNQPVLYMKNVKRWLCSECKAQFSLTSQTIFHGSKTPLPKWFEAIWLVCHSPKGISAMQLKREIGVTYKCAWRIGKQVRKAMRNNNFDDKLCGIVEVDETEVKSSGGGGGSTKSIVFGMVERDGFLRMSIIQNFKTMTIERVISQNFNNVKHIYSDGGHWLRFLKKYGKHDYIKHYQQYCDGKIHTNTIESVWSLLKRGIVGVFHHISTKYLQSYLDEFSFRFSFRKDKSSMFDAVLSSC